MPHLKKFIVGSCIALLIAILVVVTVYMYIQFALVANVDGLLDEENFESVQNKTPDSSTSTGEVVIQESQTEASPETKGIQLKDIPLSEQQTQALDTFGVDVETFVITPAMITCAETNIGATRVQEIASGGSVTFAESLKLAPCLHQ